MGLSTKTVYHIVCVSAALCFCGWVIQLAGVATLQQECPTHKDMPVNNIDPVLAFLGQSGQSLASISQMPPGADQAAAMTKFIATSYPGVIQSVGVLSSRSTNVFTLTPDPNCAAHYRYFWMNWAFQAAALVAMGLCLWKKLHVHARMSLIAWLAICTMLAIENINTSYYLYDSHKPKLTNAAYVFLSGCVITAVFNLLMISALGWDTEAPNNTRSSSESGSLSDDSDVAPKAAITV